jgi:hypothetical protein
MKRIAFLCLSAFLLLTLSACGDDSQSCAYYEFVCEGEMTVTRLSNSENATLSATETDTLLQIWGNAWEGGTAKDTFDYAFTWETTTIRYSSHNGVFQIGDNGAKMKLSTEEKAAVETIIEKIA